ncbi:hypothetical protein Q7689_03095 [Nocardiopsis tropica]|uniref:hypothetical protein n=1 Tax=Nocardiopsis tropica TaxID=109330 RepID=UPI002E8CA76F|nr:hypothetical protein [Nocardiopsis tropica]
MLLESPSVSLPGVELVVALNFTPVDVVGRSMAEETSGTVKNTVFNQGQILNMVQIGNLHGHLAIYLGDIGQLATEEVRKDYQEYLEATFVPPDRATYDRFQRDFSKERLAVLIGEPGSGRETTAIALHSSIGLSVHSVSLSEDVDSQAKAPEIRGGGPGGILSRTHPLPGIGYLVDLSGLRKVDSTIFAELHSLVARVTEKEAALTVIARPGQLDGELINVSTLNVYRPAGIEVFASHLGHLFDESVRDAWTSWRSVAELMRNASPADAARLARIAFQVKNSGHDGESFDTWVRTSIDAYGDWGADIRGWFDEHSGTDAAVWVRIILISTAFLEGTNASQMLASADLLARELKVASGDAGGLFGLGVDPTLEKVGAIRGPADVVQFRKPDYASAVLVYVWEQHPRIKEELFSWTEFLIAESKSELADTVRKAWASLALLRKDQGLTVALFNRWSRAGKTRQSAADFAADIASSPDFGSAMRARLYEVARNPTSDHQAVAVARACANYGRVNPGSALVRLKWLAEAESERTRKAVLEALEELAKDKGRWFDVIDALLQEWCGSNASENRRRIAHRFLIRSLAASESGVPALLTWLNTYSGKDKEGVGDYIADMWGALLNTEDVALALEASGTWISCTLEDENRFEEIDDIFIRAAVGGEEAEGGEEKTKGRILTAMTMVNQWCVFNGVDPRINTIYMLQAHLLSSHTPVGLTST